VDDQDRADKTIKGMVGKRLTYRAADSSGSSTQAKIAGFFQ